MMGLAQDAENLTRARPEQYLQKRPEDRAAICNPYTTVE